MSELRIGLGVDAHAFSDGVPLVLGGVAIESPRGLAGHSDGDVIAHALIDALLGGAGLGDIGSLFPPGEPEWEGASSLELLRRAAAQVHEAGWELVNADCVLIGEEPRIAPLREQMRERLAEAVGADAERINVRATTTDKLGFTGRGPRQAGRLTSSASTVTRPSRSSAATASESRSATRCAEAATRRSVAARRWRNEPSKRLCLRNGS